MKKFVSGLIIGILLTAAVSTFAASKIKSAAFNDAVKLQLDGQTISTEIVTVVKSGQTNGSNYVSARALAEAMGATVTWENNTIVVTSPPDAVSGATTSTSSRR